MSLDPLKAAVLISGTGSNLKALINAIEANALELDIVRVISNRENAPGINHATAAAIPVSVISHADFPDRPTHDAAVAEVLQQSQAELIILAGYMRILSEEFTRQYEGRMINLHPSLLPLYRGLDTYNRVLLAGDRETGASIHFVTAGLDSGPVISQVTIPVLPGDDATALKARLGPLEHKLLTATVGLFCKHEIACQQDAVLFNGQKLTRPLQLLDDGSFT
ncbi:MAG: phosphoribosylglycinamide formyltransferase [Lysobacterales bacterium]